MAGETDMGSLLYELGLTPLREHLPGTLAEYASMERVALLSHLKDNGVQKLSDRQRIATSIAKATRVKGAPAAALHTATRPELDAIEPQGFSIYCHNTTLADGTTLNNSGPAPEFVIATLEERTGVQRPENASTCSLHELNLHFMLGKRS